jgi:hypothetical protein
MGSVSEPKLFQKNSELTANKLKGKVLTSQPDIIKKLVDKIPTIA